MQQDVRITQSEVGDGARVYVKQSESSENRFRWPACLVDPEWWEQMARVMGFLLLLVAGVCSRVPASARMVRSDTGTKSVQFTATSDHLPSRRSPGQ
jgi:hypothetical protein